MQALKTLLLTGCQHNSAILTTGVVVLLMLYAELGPRYRRELSTLLGVESTARQLSLQTLGLIPFAVTLT